MNTFNQWRQSKGVMKLDLLRWSKMSGKLEGLPALNTDTTSNKFCIERSKDTNSVCNSCYSWNMLSTFRKNAVPRFRENSRIISENVLELNELPHPMSTVARFNGHGELINRNHVQNIVNFALFYPKVTFTLWTKKRGVIQAFFNKQKKPDNLLLIFSNDKIDCVYKKVPKHFDKVFNVVSKKNGYVNCEGKCIDCLKCYDTQDKSEQIVEVIK